MARDVWSRGHQVREGERWVETRAIGCCWSPAAAAFSSTSWLLEPWWSTHDVSWVSVRAPDTIDVLRDADVRWLAEESASRPWRLVGATVRAWRHLGVTRPDVVVSPGTGVAVGYFLAARLRRIPTMWLETFNMVDKPGLAARVCSRLAGAVLIQRPELLATRRNAVLVGELY